MRKDKRSERYANVAELYAKGLSTVKLAEYYGVSRQTVFKVLHRRGVTMRPNVESGERNHLWRGGTRGVRWSVNVLNVAVDRGYVPIGDCEVCGLRDRRKGGEYTIEAHHDDYRRPLDVRWLCQVHHREWHRSNVAQGRDWKPGRYRRFTGYPESRDRGPHVKLTEAKVRQILVSDKSPGSLAKQYGVSPQMISAIRKGQRWKHVTAL